MEIGLFALLWFGGLGLYFAVTTQRQRENLLLLTWGLMLLPAGYWIVRALLL